MKIKMKMKMKMETKNKNRVSTLGIAYSIKLYSIRWVQRYEDNTTLVIRFNRHVHILLLYTSYNKQYAQNTCLPVEIEMNLAKPDLFYFP